MLHSDYLEMKSTTKESGCDYNIRLPIIFLYRPNWTSSCSATKIIGKNLQRSNSFILKSDIRKPPVKMITFITTYRLECFSNITSNEIQQMLQLFLSQQYQVTFSVKVPGLETFEKCHWLCLSNKCSHNQSRSFNLMSNIQLCTDLEDV